MSSSEDEAQETNVETDKVETDEAQTQETTLVNASAAHEMRSLPYFILATDRCALKFDWSGRHVQFNCALHRRRLGVGRQTRLRMRINMSNFEPDGLRFKLEEFNSKSTATLSEIIPVTMDTLIAFKTQLQWQSLWKANTSRAQPKSRNLATAASVNRSHILAHMIPANRSNRTLQTTGLVKSNL
ncbi:hypothetical protein HYPSUDRAFT_53479 [Hypholoma sublateritium FD-334 SS-4]|uniref:Uncharacterized protein n=1 Tax=Hypholoma sublateritium (strain FD-334 SS-4) TaxID=945553 RepID=A0A0D2MM23_HYPSF|nr:hypothetical protein HYPSUDRAFT_53479 [Hypholoma sublateritium FD-334 SS-4]